MQMLSVKVIRNTNTQQRYKHEKSKYSNKAVRSATVNMTLFRRKCWIALNVCIKCVAILEKYKVFIYCFDGFTGRESTAWEGVAFLTGCVLVLGYFQPGTLCHCAPSCSPLEVLILNWQYSRSLDVNHTSLGSDGCWCMCARLQSITLLLLFQLPACRFCLGLWQHLTSHLWPSPDDPVFH